MKRVLTLFAGVLLAVAAFGVTGSAAPPPETPSRQSVAAHISRTRAAPYMTAPAQLVLRMLASRDRHLSPALLKPGASRAASGGVGPPAPAFANVRVNNPAADTNQVDQTTQSETSIAVAGPNVAVGFNDSQHTPLFFEAGTDLSGYAYSTDGGANFTDGGVIPNTPEFVNLGDPWLASDRSGNMYYATLAFDVFNFNLGIGVAKSTDGGKTWQSPVPVFRPPFEIFSFGDKPAMTAGVNPTARTRDNLYVAYDDFVFDFTTREFFTGLAVARSTDGGATWELTHADKFVFSFETCSFQQYIGAQPIVDPRNGTLYVAAEKISVDDPTCQFFNVPLQFSEWIFRSTDGGRTFEPGVKIADVTSSVPDFLLKLGPGQYMRNLEFPTLAFLGNALYVAWNDGASGKSHIRLAKSTDEGHNWSLSSATQGANDELQPALSSDSEGLHLLYYQRNNDNTLDVFVADSRNGTSFTTRRVTTRSFPGVFTFPPFDPIIAFGYMGDYIANVSDGSHQYFAWGDNRDRVTNFMWPSGRNDPNVYFAKQ